MAWTLRSNDVFDPDPLLLTGGITGFAEMSAFYERFIVQQMHSRVTFANRESFPIKVGVVLTPSSILPSITSRALALDALERFGQVACFELSSQGGMDRKTCNFTFDPAAVLGHPGEYHNSGLYSGTSSSSPTRFIFVTYILVAPSSVATLANGVFYSNELNYKTKFYSVAPKLLGLKQITADAIVEQKEKLARRTATLNPNAPVWYPPQVT